MKAIRWSATGLLLASSMILFSCKKVGVGPDGEVQESKVDKKSSCFITSLDYSNSAQSQTVFKTQFNSEGNAFRIEAGTHSGGVINSTIVLNIVNSGSSIAFVNAASPSDTILIASLNNRGKVEKISEGNKPDFAFPPTTFEYINDRVTAMHITLGSTTTTSNFLYDNKNNNTSIEDQPTASVPVPGKVTYEYTNQKAGQQFYMDEPRGFSWNSFSLLQYAGLFPELNPSNLRSHTKVMWGNNYQAYDLDISNHQVDGNGNLTSYEVVSPNSGDVVSKYNLAWSCSNGY
ncbi:MAG TPA: hypothetical protein VJT83_03455 [Chitinophagaceae bacterium]|nr:hypothetical protein [Chitinophagaceae bacterium]